VLCNRFATESTVNASVSNAMTHWWRSLLRLRCATSLTLEANEAHPDDGLGVDAGAHPHWPPFPMGTVGRTRSHTLYTEQREAMRESDRCLNTLTHASSSVLQYLNLDGTRMKMKTWD